MTDHLSDAFRVRQLDTARLATALHERDGDDPETPPERTLVFLHDVLASSVSWHPLLRSLPSDLRVLAIDLRGFGDSENLPVDATRGVRDFADDLAAVLDALGLPTAHLVGWGLGGTVALQYAQERPVLSLTLIAPFSPYGLGGTRRDGTRLTDDDAGSGAVTANPELVRRLIARDTGDEAESSARSILRHAFFAPGFVLGDEDAWVDAMLQTSTATGNYPGDTVASAHWPGSAAGSTGVLNALAPQHLDLSDIVRLDPKPPVLWVRGLADAIVSDTSFADPRHLGSLGVIPDWPGEETAPAQPMVSQTRDVLDAYAAAGGAVRELTLAGVGHTPHVERTAIVRQAILEHLGLGFREPSPATEAIVLRSEN
ncbi:alpha/beta hydrolase [Microbacterium sp. SORGH_AS_0888]|uniref:alpha/beta hydrolase n=1 Tax=Microbacterium sp. SORGH_AS_0888 TaxID=3041791 RepID=UPI0027892E0E|nr:alpha/beta hydrolase [Microbacterium sp. SORGH_AS_0888]MDQ1130621.1 pimeloyl-ACP methyl ester carboxylesterase [Microbacterium sp. SORGH_AS_0888]